MEKLIGRKREIAELQSYLESDKSEFVMVYGRRRVGKTFLIKSFFENNFDFQYTGMANSTMKQQLMNFHFTLVKQFSNDDIPVPQNWISTFNLLIRLLEEQKNIRKKKVIFFDEMPCMDSARSDFMQALENFWNSWASSRDDIVLIACGSATSWMTNKLINNKGGLHNHVTQRLKLLPFTLQERKQYLLSHNIDRENRDIVMSYMIFGGIPFYLSLIKSNLSLKTLILFSLKKMVL